MNTWAERFPHLWAFGERLGVLVIGGTLFFLFSALIVTIPPALAGLFAAVAPLIRPTPGETIVRFWRGFRRTFGRSLLLGLLNLVIGFVLWFDFRFFWYMDTPVTKVAAFLFASLGAVVVIANVYVWPLLAWYPQPLGRLLRRALLLGAAHPLWALAGLASLPVLALLFLVLPGPVKALPVLLGPGLGALCLGAAAWQAMKRYAGPDDEFAE